MTELLEVQKVVRAAEESWQPNSACLRVRLGTAPSLSGEYAQDMNFTMAVWMYVATMAAFAQDTKVTPLLTKDLTGIPGKEGQMLTVEYAPGAAGTVHRHNAHVFVYVLEGSIVMQVRGGKEVTLGPGETFYETPEDVHVVGRNASASKSAKFLVFFVKDKGAPGSVPVK